jgi:MerR family redox-sensitive transcriptional activator SoxR
MARDRALDIGEVAKKSGLPVSTLRFYEEKGLIQSTGRHGLRRLFHSQVLEQLEFIALGRHAGFSLEEIASMFAVDGRLKIDRKKLLSKAEQVDQNIKQLIAVRDGLQHVAHCKAPSHLECPKFQRLLRVAGKRNPQSIKRRARAQN